jgi:drug/metabolite transporter (DMT)-like permease
MFLQTAVAALVLLPAALLLPGPASPRQWAAVASLGLAMTTVPFLLYLRGLSRTRVDRVGVVSLAEPVSAALLASAFLGEQLTPPVIMGGAGVLLAGFLALRLPLPPHRHGLEGPAAAAGSGDRGPIADREPGLSTPVAVLTLREDDSP